MVRSSTYSDIPRICEILSELHQISKYAGYQINMRQFKELCMESIRSGNNCLFVYEENGSVEGFLIGIIDNLYHVLREKYASDLFFCKSLTAKGDATGLMAAFLEWAKSQPGVVSIRMGATDVVSDYNKVSKLYDRCGMIQEGVLYEMRIEQ